MARHASGRSAHYGMMVGEVPGHSTCNSTADAALRFRRGADGEAGWNGDHQGGMKNTHRYLPELLGSGATCRVPSGSD